MERKVDSIVILLVALLMLLSLQCRQVPDFSNISSQPPGTGGEKGDSNEDGGGDAGQERTPSSDKSIENRFVQSQYADGYSFLWVIDNSISMENERASVIRQLNQFVATLQRRRVFDYSMAVTTTDFLSNSGNLIRSAEGIEVILSGDANPVERWKSILSEIQVSPLSFWEQGLESSIQAISKHGHKFAASGFPLVVVFLTDEEDYSCERFCVGPEPERNALYQRYPMTRYFDFFTEFSIRNDQPVIFYPMVHLPNALCENLSVGSRYQILQNHFNTGETLSICPSALESNFVQVAAHLSDRGLCFSLSHRPEVESVVVWVENNELSPEAYQLEAQRVCFGPAYLPKNGSEIVVRYRVHKNEV